MGLQRYFLTICCYERRPSFEGEAAIALVLTHLSRTAADCDTAVFVYCFMPDHLHLVVEGESDSSDCLEFVRLLKQPTGYAWKHEYGDRLWQDSFYDHVLRDAESTQKTVRYVLENPVRAKLVTSPAEYPHSGSLLYDRAALFEWAFGWIRPD
jgi:REP-associated tyrosine transposase